MIQLPDEMNDLPKALTSLVKVAIAVGLIAGAVVGALAVLFSFGG